MTIEVRDIEVRELVKPEELARCASLYQSAFSLRPEDGSLNPRLLVGLVKNGGIVVGAFSDDLLVGYALSFLALQGEGEDLYQYSQNAAVLPEWQGRGIGRRLKLAQRAIALGRKIQVMRWAFDPLNARNAHFNLDVLGTFGSCIERNLYGEHGGGPDADTSTHRMIVEWTLDSDRVSQLSDGITSLATELTEIPKVGHMQRGSSDKATLSIPVTVKDHQGSEEKALRESIVDSIEALFNEGLVAVSCRRVDAECAVYQFVPRQYVQEKVSPS
jgi:predicted GNAT superfamily acetyltransferase